MNLKQLEVFLAVTDSGSFSKGAEATFITQSTVSQHILALEQEVGIKLLDRTARGALLTGAGKIVESHARRIVGEIKEIRLAIDRFKGLDDVELTIGASTIPGDYMIPVALPVLQQLFPGLSLTVLQGDSRDVLNKVLREEAEIGIVGSRFADEALVFSPLGSDRLVLIVGESHEWFDRPTAGLDELQSQRFITREPGSGTWKTVREALTAAGLDPARLDIRICLGSNEAIKHAVADGAGISFISEHAVRREIGRHELSEVKIPGLDISRSFYLATLAGRESSPAAAAFAKVMVEMYG